MNPQATDFGQTGRPPYFFASLALVGVGLVGFVGLTVFDPARAWQAYLVNFLLFSAIAQGAVLFSAVMQVVGARWSGPLANLAEAFAAFFPVSVALFVILPAGGEHVFPWRQADLHGKEVWLNLPFLFGRDLVGLLVLYGLGYVYVYHVLRGKLDSGGTGPLRNYLSARWRRESADGDRWHRRTTVLAVLYILAFALVVSLIGFDLVMAADPHWYSTLFGAYSFVKAIYTGFGAIIILAALLHLSPRFAFRIDGAQLHDISKLFFAFCLVWADFFYAQFVVIWYGNIPEETAYVIERTLHAPWAALAWTVFILGFILPFLILINKKIKTVPAAMAVICAGAIIAIWLEHFLLLGPALFHGAASLPMGLGDVLVGLGFAGLLAMVLFRYLNAFPELVRAAPEDAP
jgi:hypothetical protein